MAGDFAVQASIRDVLMNNRLIVDAARAAGASSPLLDVCHRLYGEALALGHAGADMAAVVHAVAARSDSARCESVRPEAAQSEGDPAAD